MKIKYLIFLLPTFIFSQNYFPHLDKSITETIIAGDDCLKANKENCFAYYDKAIAIATNMPDSTLVMTYKEISESIYYYGTLADAEKYTRSGLAIAKPKEHPITTIKFYKRLANIFTRLEKNDSIIPAFENALKWAKYSNDFAQISDVYMSMADAYHRQGKVKRAIETLTIAKPFADKSTNNRVKIGLVFVMGNIYMANKDNEQAKESFEEAMQIAKGKDDWMYNLSLINWGIIMNNLGRPLPVIEKLPSTVTFFEGNMNQQHANTQLARAYLLVNNNDKSIQLGLKNIEQAKKIKDQSLISLNARLLSRNYLKLGELNLGLKYASLAFEGEIEKGSIDEEVLEAYKLEAQALKANGKLNEALNKLEKYTVLNDSLYALNKQKEIQNLQEYYETEVKNTKILLQQQEIGILNEKAKVDTLTKTLYGVGAISGIALSGLLFFGFRQRIKKNKIAREKQEEIYKQEIAFKKKELTSQTLHLVQKSTFIQELKENLEKIKKSPELFKVEFRRLVMLLKKESAEDKDWEVFKSYFSEVHNNFDNKIKLIAQDISEKEIRLASFLRMNLSTKEIASMLNVLPDSVLKSKYRLKKKLNLDKETDLTQFLNTL